jgi:hypothetical protein
MIWLDAGVVDLPLVSAMDPIPLPMTSGQRLTMSLRKIPLVVLKTLGLTRPMITGTRI